MKQIKAGCLALIGEMVLLCPRLPNRPSENTREKERGVFSIVSDAQVKFSSLVFWIKEFQKKTIEVVPQGCMSRYGFMREDQVLNVNFPSKKSKGKRLPPFAIGAMTWANSLGSIASNHFR